MKVYLITLCNSIKMQWSYKMDFMGLAFYPILSIILRISIWNALYISYGQNSINNISQQSMITYCIISQFMQAFVKTKVMQEINSKVLSGDICYILLLPKDVISHCFWTSLSNQIMNTIYFAVVPFIFSVFIYGLHFETMTLLWGVFGLSVFLAFVLYYLYSFIMGISVVWLRNAFFLENLDEALFSLFSGIFVPMWFFPVVLEKISRILPFRYIIFEPMNIVLGNISYIKSMKILCIQIVYIAFMYILCKILWKSARKNIIIHGG